MADKVAKADPELDLERLDECRHLAGRFSPGSLDVPRGARWRGAQRNAELALKLSAGDEAAQETD